MSSGTSTVGPLPARRRFSGAQRDDLLGYALMTPILLVVALLILLPLGIVFWDSLHNKTFTGPQYDFVGIDNYAKLLTSGTFWATMLRSAIWTVSSVLLQIVVGFALAIVLNQSFRGRSIFRGVFLLPWVIPVVVLAVIWKWMLNDLYGIANFLLGLINPAWGGIAWFSDQTLALPTLIAINVWRGAPFVMVILLAGLQTVPRELVEAAAIDGASRLQQFRHVTLPHLRTILLVVLLVFTLFNFNNFDLIFLTTQGGPLDRTMILPVKTYEIAFEGLRVSEASATAVLMLLTIGVMALIYLRLVQPTESETTR